MFDRIIAGGLSGPHPVSGNASPGMNPFIYRKSIIGITPILVVISALLCFGCSNTTTSGGLSDEIREEGERLFADDGDHFDPGAAIYTIRLMDVPQALAGRPDLAVAQVINVVGPGVRVIRPDPSAPAVLVYGQYSGPLSERARTDTRRIRDIVVDGNYPFAAVAMMKESDPKPSSGRLSRFDLRNVKNLLGDSVLYTLQIGIYTRDDNATPSRQDLASFRKSAEEAVEQLRREETAAFFYHGPTGSMVTVGTFSDDDLDTTVVPPLESARLSKARADHPYNLLNGRGLRESRRGARGSERLQPSRLVLIPKK